MATAHLLQDGFRIRSGLDVTTVELMYHVTDITGWNSENTETAVLAYVPFVRGQPHPEYGNAICLDKVLHKKINPTDALVYVFFSSRTTSTRRFRSSSTRGFSGTVQVPYWTRTTSSAGTDRWFMQFKTEQREHALKVETRYVRNGSLTDTAIGTMHNLVGTVFRFPDNVNGIPYLLKSPSITDWAPGQSRLIYTFETTCRLPEMLVSTISGQDLRLPPLGYLDEWYAPLGGNGVPLPIAVRTWQSRYSLSFQFQLPFLD